MIPVSVTAPPRAASQDVQLAVVQGSPMPVAISTAAAAASAKKRSKWTESELCVLLAAKREDMDRYQAGGLKEKSKTQSVRWASVASQVNRQGVARTQRQCQDKWDSVYTVSSKKFPITKKQSLLARMGTGQ